MSGRPSRTQPTARVRGRAAGSWPPRGVVAGAFFGSPRGEVCGGGQWALGRVGGTISEISARIADVGTTRTTVSSVRAGTAEDAYGAGGGGGCTGRRARRGVRRPRRRGA